MKKLYKIAFNRYTIASLLTAIVFLSIMSCGNKKEDLIDVKFDPEVTPSMVTDSVTTLISDSGITRYKLITDSWHIFDKAKEPFWYFPEGLYLERFDENLETEATILSDTAWNYTDKKLWKLKGNVEITNLDGDEFRSDELFWDQNTAKVYSDKYIEIKRGALELKGFGFESNQEMTDYRIFKPHDGKLPVEEKDNNELDLTNNEEEHLADSIKQIE